MDFGHDTVCALGTAVELVNTAPELSDPDDLPDVAALEDFVAHQQVSEVGPITAADLEDVHALRAEFHAVWTAPSQQKAVDLVNGIVARARTTPRLTNHDGYQWHMHYFAPGVSLAEHLAADLGMAVGFVLAAEERERLRVCEAPDCRHVFVDLSRNRCRRYCDSRTCGNRLHVAAYRARKAAAG
ncbi:MAG: CGNR zinc finger domain-containing protein [Actinomycetes bacterium]